MTVIYKYIMLFRIFFLGIIFEFSYSELFSNYVHKQVPNKTTIKLGN